jgi:hypothetical protein
MLTLSTGVVGRLAGDALPLWKNASELQREGQFANTTPHLIHARGAPRDGSRAGERVRRRGCHRGFYSWRCERVDPMPAVP